MIGHLQREVDVRRDQGGDNNKKQQQLVGVQRWKQICTQKQTYTKYTDVYVKERKNIDTGINMGKD